MSLLDIRANICIYDKKKYRWNANVYLAENSVYDSILRTYISFEIMKKEFNIKR